MSDKVFKVLTLIVVIIVSICVGYSFGTLAGALARFIWISL